MPQTNKIWEELYKNLVESLKYVSSIEKQNKRDIKEYLEKGKEKRREDKEMQEIYKGLNEMRLFVGKTKLAVQTEELRRGYEKMASAMDAIAKYIQEKGNQKKDPERYNEISKRYHEYAGKARERAKDPKGRIREISKGLLETKVVSSIILFFLSITLLTIPRITGNVIQDKLNKIDIIGIMGIVASFIILSYYLLKKRV